MCLIQCESIFVPQTEHTCMWILNPLLGIVKAGSVFVQQLGRLQTSQFLNWEGLQNSVPKLPLQQGRLVPCNSCRVDLKVDVVVASGGLAEGDFGSFSWRKALDSSMDWSDNFSGATSFLFECRRSYIGNIIQNGFSDKINISSNISYMEFLKYWFPLLIFLVTVR